MKTKKFAINFLILATLFSLALVGCGNDEKKAPVKYDLAVAPVSLDPQFVSSSSEIEVLLNCYAGLFRERADGEIENMCCEEYSVSRDGLRYEFKIKDDIFYSNDKKKDFVSERVTAYDFAFAFERLFNFSYPSPHAKRFLSIKNSQEVLNGEMPVSSLGAYAIDDKTFVIELERKDAWLIKNLCHPSALPVSRAYFEKTKGKFGVDDDNIVTNGAFKISAWDKDKYITLRRNENNEEKNITFLNGIDFLIDRQESKIELFKNSRADVIRLSKAEYKNQANLRARIIEKENAVWAIGFNQASDTFNNSHITNALSMAVDREKLQEELEGSELRLTASLVSSESSVASEKYRGQEVVNRYNPIKSKEEMALGLEELGLSKIRGKSILVPEGNEVFNSCQGLFQDWQRNCSFFLELREESQGDYEEKIKNGDFDLAIFKITTKGASPYFALSDFKINSPANFISYENESYDKLLDRALIESSPQKSIALFKEAEDMLLRTGKIIPLVTDGEVIAVNEGLYGEEIYPSDQLIYFVNAYR